MQQQLYLDGVFEYMGRAALSNHVYFVLEVLLKASKWEVDSLLTVVTRFHIICSKYFQVHFMAE